MFAVTGIEKLLPRLADLDVFLRIIGRSGTGQAITSYQSLITGPKRSATDDGPEELHIVLLDNGRSELLSKEVTAQDPWVYPLRCVPEHLSRSIDRSAAMPTARYTPAPLVRF